MSPPVLLYDRKVLIVAHSKCDKKYAPPPLSKQAYLLAGFWELGNVFSSGDVAVHIMHSKRMRPGLSKKP